MAIPAKVKARYAAHYEAQKAEIAQLEAARNHFKERFLSGKLDPKEGDRLSLNPDDAAALAAYSEGGNGIASYTQTQNPLTKEKHYYCLSIYRGFRDTYDVLGGRTTQARYEREITGPEVRANGKALPLRLKDLVLPPLKPYLTALPTRSPAGYRQDFERLAAIRAFLHKGLEKLAKESRPPLGNPFHPHQTERKLNMEPIHLKNAYIANDPKPLRFKDKNGNAIEAIAFSVIKNEREKQADGSFKTVSVKSHDVTFTGTNAQHIGTLLKTGMAVNIEGTLHEKTFTTKDGKEAVRAVLRANDITLSLAQKRIRNIEFEPAKKPQRAPEAPANGFER